MFTITSTQNTSVNTLIQITIAATSTANAVMYTVPTGRKFIGRIGNTTSGYGTYVNSALIPFFQGSGGTNPTAAALFELTLLAGTVIKEQAANSTYIYGVESDA